MIYSGSKATAKSFSTAGRNVTCQIQSVNPQLLIRSTGMHGVKTESFLCIITIWTETTVMFPVLLL